jgi:predicted P-loop ATPase/GTPase
MQESVSMTRAALFLAACVLAVSPANASAYLSEEQARAKAVKILTGDPYGTTTEDVLKTIGWWRASQRREDPSVRQSKAAGLAIPHPCRNSRQ